MNGFQPTCPSDEQGTFGRLGALLREDGYRVEFFNSCVERSGPLELLAERFTTFLNDRQLTRYDVVAHSMGGLILRTYLSGKQREDGVFTPPANVGVRKAVFAGTPHGGTRFGEGFEVLLGNPAVLTQIRPGSRTLFDLGRWNQGRDDLREIDALMLVGRVPETQGDAVVNATSAAFPWLAPERQIALPYCHTSDNILVSCRGTLPLVAPENREHLTYRIVSSFLAGTNDWRTIGQNAASTPAAFTNYAIVTQVNDAQNRLLLVPGNLTLSGVSNNASRNGALFYWDPVPRGTEANQLRVESQNATYPLGPTLGTLMTIVKPGPNLAAVAPLGGVPNTLSRAPGMLVSLYGANLTNITAQASSLPLPSTLGETTVRLGDGRSLLLQFVSPTQINALVPEDATGYHQVIVTSPLGSTSLGVLFETASPSLFTFTEPSGSTLAIGYRADGALLATGATVVAGDVITLFATGLGQTERRGNLDWARLAPEVTIGGVRATLLYAGRAPEFPGLDQINVQVPAGVQPGRRDIVVRSSNRATLPAGVEVR
jgi:uncharacterized protein (TIGR03437 family)